MPLLSIIVPCFNEESVLRATHERLLALRDGLDDIDVELVYVDDGSDDGTLALLREFSSAAPDVRVVVLSRNFGQQIAISAGLAAVGGDAVVVIDADLQDPPEVIPEMLVRWRDGADVAYGVRTSRAGEGAGIRWRSRVFLGLLGRLSDTEVRRDVGEFCLLDRKVVDVLATMPERHRFLRAMVPWAGFRQEPVYFRRDPRAGGATKWRLGGTLRLGLDALLSFSAAPLRLAVWLGFAVAGVAMVGILYALAQRLLTDGWVPGWATLLIATLFIGGIQLVVVGVLGEYMARIYAEVKRRPLYLVRERLGFPPAPAADSPAPRMASAAERGECP